MSRQVNTTTSSTPDRQGFAARLHEALGSTTSESFARQLGRPLRTVQRWRNGESEPSGETLIAIARALDRDPAWFYAEHESAEQAA